MSRLLIIDDEPFIAQTLRAGMRALGVEVVTAATAADGLAAITSQQPDAILLDIGLPDLSGLELVQRIQQLDRRTPVIIMTGQGTTETAILAMKLGAYDYVTKPFSFARVRELILRAIEIGRSMRAPVRLAQTSASASDSSATMIGRSAAMQEVFKMIGRIAPQEGIVLIRGESGTGKELVARAIYQHSRRARGPFLAINCAAIPETLLESELFGHEKGAFTGADRKRVGKFEQCNGGTLFLDEIGDMSPLTQTKVLRVLQDQQFEPVGGSETIRTDVRVIAATNRDLETMVASGRFRQDLYYRLNVFTITLPPLRERAEDIPLLVEHFVERFNREMGREVQQVAPETLQILERYHWPGNLRELQSVLRQALLRAAGPILLPEFLPASVRSPAEPPATSETGERSPADDWDRFLEERLKAGSSNLHEEWLAVMERHLLTRVLRHTEGNQSRAAAILGVTRRSLRNRIRTLGITIKSSIEAEDGPDDAHDSDPESESHEIQPDD